MANNRKKTRLIELLREEIQIRDAFLASLEDEVRNAPGSLQSWSVKDTLAHLQHWKQVWVERLGAAARGEPVEIEKDALDANDRAYPLYQDWSWEQVLASDTAATEGKIAWVEKLSEEDLTTLGKFPWAENRALQAHIFSDGFSHPLIHFAQIAVAHGDLEQAIQLNQRIAQAMQELDDSPYVQALANYNLACFYALAGKSQDALGLLSKALPLAPNLVEWSKEDPDLDSLRQLPEFQALYS